jgi:membrane-bound metal-dependent hydrolase YbcI (DUF457 family)
MVEGLRMNGRTHKVAGAVVGVPSVVGFRAAERKPLRVGELAGGLVGGVAGAMLPDVLEPATSSYHRSIAHSVTVSTGAVWGATRNLGNVRQWLDDKADALRARSSETESWLEQLIFSLGALLVDFLNGLVTGVVPGYVSHVVLDSLTPRSVPIFA